VLEIKEGWVGYNRSSREKLVTPCEEVTAASVYMLIRRHSLGATKSREIRKHT